MSQKVGIITALPQETEHLQQAMTDMKTTVVGGYTFTEGDLDSCDIVLVECGMGKVHAATVTTLLCAEFSIGSIVFSGVAGGLDPNLDIGDVVIGRHVIQHDFGSLVDKNFEVYHPGHLPFINPTDRLGYTLDTTLENNINKSLQHIDLPEILQKSLGGRTPHLSFGTILTGDLFLNCSKTRESLYEQYAAQAVEMEGAAVTQVAEMFGCPAVIVRCLSDLSGAPARVDLMEFLSDAGSLAASVVRQILPEVSKS